jgi:two-component system CheB/CheR fusion protein
VKTDPEPDEAFERLLEHVRDSRGFDFTGYKRASLMRRTDRRMQEVGVDDYSSYVDYLEVHPEEFTGLFNSILINVTSFFRDAPVWEYLAQYVMPAICDDRGDDQIRVWCAGCASGEEAYSIAMLLAEHLGDEAFQGRVKIYATDADDDAIATARLGIYPAKAADAIGAERLGRFFEANGDGYAFRRDLRRSLIFGRHDLVQDAPIRRTDLVSCRNTLMYMNSETQARVLDHFRFSLSEDGFLLLGKSEMLFTKVRAFVPVDLKRRVFAKQGGEDRVEMRAWGATGRA